MANVSNLSFKESLSRHQVAQVVSELVKCLIFQRHQIPLTVESMTREVNNFHQHSNGQVLEHPDCSADRNSRKLRHAKVRKDKLRQKFVKYAEKFLASFQALETLIFQVVLGHEVKEIVFALGLSSNSPKEVYIIELPETWASPVKLEDHQVKEFSRKIIRVLRPLLCNNEQLFDVLMEKCPLTNMFLAFKMDIQVSLAAQLTPKLNFDKWPAKSKICRFAIQHDVDNNSKRPAFITGNDTYTPTAMEMCTPFQDKNSRKRPLSGSSNEADKMIETPIQKTKPLPDSSVVEQTDYAWFYCNSVLKGFRDPQVSLSNN